MEKVEYREIERWEWECPVCGNWMEEPYDPSYTGKVTCDGCFKQFEPVKG